MGESPSPASMSLSIMLRNAVVLPAPLCPMTYAWRLRSSAEIRTRLRRWRGTSLDVRAYSGQGRGFHWRLSFHHACASRRRAGFGFRLGRARCASQPRQAKPMALEMGRLPVR